MKRDHRHQSNDDMHERRREQPDHDRRYDCDNVADEWNDEHEACEHAHGQDERDSGPPHRQRRARGVEQRQRHRRAYIAAETVVDAGKQHAHVATVSLGSDADHRRTDTGSVEHHIERDDEDDHGVEDPFDHFRCESKSVLSEAGTGLIDLLAQILGVNAGDIDIDVALIEP